MNCHCFISIIIYLLVGIGKEIIVTEILCIEKYRKRIGKRSVGVLTYLLMASSKVDESYEDDDFEDDEESYGDDDFEEEEENDDVKPSSDKADIQASSHVENVDNSSRELVEEKAENDGGREGGTPWEVADMDDVDIGERIGGGGFAIVYEGYWKGRHVALKTLFDPRVDEKLKKEFMDELHVMSSLNHPNVVELFAANVKPPKMLFIMELCDRSLYQLLHLTAEKLEVETLVQMAKDFAAGMAYLHRQKPAIIHRDIKSPNLLLTIDLRIKLCDFGLVTTRITTAGTPSYMAPELLKNKPFSKEVDVYAFGIVLWEMFAREVPWNAMDPHEIRDRVVRGERPEIPRFDVPETVRELVQSSWAQDPRDRKPFEEIYSVLNEWKAPISHVRESADGFGDSLEDLLRK